MFWEADEKGRKYPKFRATKHCLYAITQRAANDSNVWGANRTIVVMDYTENADTVFALNQRFVKAGSDIMCDENPAYKSLDFHYTRWSVNHQEAYSTKGVNNNLAESFNARMRDLMRGTHHKTDNKYALHYANQAAFFSDNRRKSNRYSLKISSNVACGYCHLKSGSVTGKEIIAKVSFSV